MKEFLKSTFRGTRFDEHTLPMEIMRDLLAYETLIVELAKHLYREKYPNRQRLPRGFAAGFQLHLKDVESGSAVPVMVTPTGEQALVHFIPPEYEEARDIVNACVAGVNQPNFPQKFYSYFNTIGRSLKADEVWDFGNGARLTPKRRKELVLQNSRLYEQEVEITGIVEEFNARAGFITPFSLLSIPKTP